MKSSPARLLALLVLVTTTTACKGDPAPAAKPTASAATPIDAGGPPTVALPTGACRLTSELPLPGVPLRLTPAGPPYGIAGTTMASMASFGTKSTPSPKPTFSVEVIVPDDPGAPLGLRYQTDRLTAVGLVARDDLEVHPVRAVLAGGFLITTQVRVGRATGEQVEIAPALGTEIELIDGGAPASVACSDLSLEEPDQPRALAPAEPAGSRGLQLRIGEPVELSVEPGGPAVARLHADADSDLVDVLEVRGEVTRILWYRAGAIVFGWVPSVALSKPTPGGLNNVSSMGIPRPSPRPSLRCGHEVPLLVQLGADRTRVGAIRAEAAIDVAERAGGLARLHPITRPSGGLADLAPASGATFWVDEGALAGCATVPPVPPDDDALGFDLGAFTGLPGPDKKK